VTKEIGTLPMDSRKHYLTHREKHFGEERSFLEQRWELAKSSTRPKSSRTTSSRHLSGSAHEHFVRACNITHAYEDTGMPIG
jgi:hypothetical protein